jgi:phosphatidylglycerol:prolipoprotein diacylglycerol transferase
VQYPQEIDLCYTDPVTRLTSPGSELQQTPEQWQKLLELARTLAPEASADGLRAGLHRLSHEGWRYEGQLRPLISARHPSQLYQAAAEGLVLGLILIIVWAKPRKPGIIGALFMVVYGVLRILTELIRLPDAQLQVKRPGGLSLGQWLSVGMIVVGASVLVYVSRQAVAKVGGWLGAAKAA